MSSTPLILPCPEQRSRGDAAKDRNPRPCLRCKTTKTRCFLVKNLNACLGCVKISADCKPGKPKSNSQGSSSSSTGTDENLGIPSNVVQTEAAFASQGNPPYEAAVESCTDVLGLIFDRDVVAAEPEAQREGTDILGGIARASHSTPKFVITLAEYETVCTVSEDPPPTEQNGGSKDDSVQNTEIDLSSLPFSFNFQCDATQSPSTVCLKCYEVAPDIVASIILQPHTDGETTRLIDTIKHIHSKFEFQVSFIQGYSDMFGVPREYLDAKVFPEPGHVVNKDKHCSLHEHTVTNLCM